MVQLEKRSKITRRTHLLLHLLIMEALWCCSIPCGGSFLCLAPWDGKVLHIGAPPAPLIWLKVAKCDPKQNMEA